MRFFGDATGAGEIRSLDGALAIYSGLDYGVFNIALLEGDPPDGIDGFTERLAQCARYFAPRTMRWSFWLCEDSLDSSTRRRARVPVDGSRPAPHLASPRNAGRSAGAAGAGAAENRMRAGRGSDHAAGFRRPHLGELRYPHAESRKPCTSRSEPGCGDYRGFVGMAGGKPVAIAAIVATPDALGVYSLSTLPECRRLGYGEALLRAAVAVRTSSGPGSGAWCSSRPMRDIRCTGGWDSTRSRSSRCI